MAKEKKKSGKKKKGKMSAKKGKASKENEEEAAQFRAAEVKKLKLNYPLQCKKFICEPIPAVVKRIDKAAQSLEDVDKIIITNYTMTPSDVWSVYTTFESYILLTTICLWSCPLDISSIDALSKFIIRHPAILTLHLIDCKITPSMTPYITRILRESRTLATLLLDHNPLASVGAINVFAGVRMNPAAGQIPGSASVVPGGLKVLSMRYCDIGHKAAEEIGYTISRNCSLTEVDLGGNSIADEGLIPIAKSLAANATLKTLNLSANNINNREMGQNQQPILINPLAIQIKSSSPLNPNLPALPTLQSSIAILCGVLSNENTGLQFLDLSGNHIGPIGGEAILEMLKSRKPLALSKKSEALQVDLSERMGSELYSDIMDMNDVMDDLAKKNSKAGGKKGGKKGKK